MNKKKRIVIALGGNALGNTLPEQMAAVKVTSKAIVDLIEEGCEVVVTHGNGPQVGMINNAMIALTHEDAQQPNTPLSVCVAMSQAYIGYDLQNALREELFNRGITDIPVATMITQVRVNEDDPAFNNPSKPIGKFFNEETHTFPCAVAKSFRLPCVYAEENLSFAQVAGMFYLVFVYCRQVGVAGFSYYRYFNLFHCFISTTV